MDSTKEAAEKCERMEWKWEGSRRQISLWLEGKCDAIDKDNICVLGCENDRKVNYICKYVSKWCGRK